MKTYVKYWEGFVGGRLMDADGFVFYFIGNDICYCVQKKIYGWTIVFSWVYDKQDQQIISYDDHFDRGYDYDGICVLQM